MRAILAWHLAFDLDGIFHDMTAFRPAVPPRWSKFEADPVPPLEGAVVRQVPKPDREQTLEFAVGRDPGAANRFPVLRATLR